ncbi:piggyBac transposable element-derived protein 3-like [Portunus trituberculatus]|uniref:piggyBac transposable element-derived protein 3-like n=1 Tax=Portunus trituberculatus TaxID=210409 RepID=UPI001E1D1695|nr:piggyBac transposable element-derived protein 3-like [Portunus trituberculatus]
MLSSIFYGHGENEHFVTVREACDRAEEDGSRVRNVVVLPPESGDQDVESDVEDATSVMSSDEEAFEPAGEVEVDDTDDSEDGLEEPPSKSSRATGWKKKSEFRRNLCYDPLEKLVDSFPDLTKLSPYQLWGLIFSSSILDTIVDQTNLYARRDKNQPNFSANHDEIRTFLGIILLSGYHRLPEERHYWSTQPDLGVQLVSAAMTRNRFQALKSVMHFADNHNLPAGNKCAKIEPIYTIINENLKKHGIFHQKLSVDESMVPYYGRHSAKMFIRGKPIRFGYKIWALCGNDGYPYRLKLYKGKENDQTKLPLGIRVVNDMMSTIQSSSTVTKHEVYFDNFFTSHFLLKSLAEKNIKATGTIRENRTAGAAKLMKSNAAMKKDERGEFDFRCDGEVYVCKWNDNSIVNIASNHETHLPLHEATRRVKKSSKVKVKQPHLVRKYNEGMGGLI